MIDKRSGEEKKPVKTQDTYFPQELPKPCNEKKIPSQRPAPGQVYND